VSPKFSSLAIDEMAEQSHIQPIAADFEPKLTVIVNPRSEISDSSLHTGENFAKIEGRITVSF